MACARKSERVGKKLRRKASFITAETYPDHPQIHASHGELRGLQCTLRTEVPRQVNDQFDICRRSGKCVANGSNAGAQVEVAVKEPPHRRRYEHLGIDDVLGGRVFGVLARNAAVIFRSTKRPTHRCKRQQELLEVCKAIDVFY